MASIQDLWRVLPTNLGDLYCSKPCTNLACKDLIPILTTMRKRIIRAHRLLLYLEQRLWNTFERRQEKRELKVTNSATKNPLTPVTINVPGERDASSVTKQFQDNQISIWCRSSNRSCMTAFFFNAIYLLEGEERENDLLKSRTRAPYTNFKDVSKWAHSKIGSISLKVIDPEDGSGEGWLTELQNRIYIVYISVVKGVKHVVTIDAAQ